MITKEFILERCLVDPITGCWIWQKKKNWQGYGKASECGKSVFVHRRAYELWNEPLTPGLFALHDCPVKDNPSCCNPAHLYRGTRGDNNRDSVKKGQQRIVNRKLNADQVSAIRNDPRTQQVIAAHYGIHQNTVSRVKRKEAYANVP